jgi:dipeptidyl aminopeptidase/acylaminoacyl peptidase
MPSVERLEWRSARGESFMGVLLLPPGRPTGRLPLFLNYYHCGGFLSGGVGNELPFLPLAASGIAAACINLPPAAGLDDFLGRYDMALRAVRTLVEALDRRGLIDPARVGMAGLSFGSEATMWTLMKSKLIAAAAIASSQIEPTYYWFNSVRGRSQPEVLRRFWQLGAPNETPEEWRRHSAALNVDRIGAPLLMQLPEQEARNVPQLYSRLSRTLIPTELYVFPDAAHIKLQPRHRLAAHQRYLDWFRFWLQDSSDTDPAKAAQYRRWNGLRARWRRASSAP